MSFNFFKVFIDVEGFTNTDNESRRLRTRTVQVWTAQSRSCPAGQTYNGQLFILKSGQNRDRIVTGKTDRHASESIFKKIWIADTIETDRIRTEDKIPTADRIEIDRIRTDRHLIDTGQVFRKS